MIFQYVIVYIAIKMYLTFNMIVRNKKSSLIVTP